MYWLVTVKIRSQTNPKLDALILLYSINVYLFLVGFHDVKVNDSDKIDSSNRQKFKNKTVFNSFLVWLVDCLCVVSNQVFDP